MELATYGHVDTLSIWRCIENIECEEVRSLNDVLRWVCRRDLKARSSNRGDDAAKVVLAVRSLLSHEDVWAARWRLFGAHTLAQIPNGDTIRLRAMPSIDTDLGFP